LIRINQTLKNDCLGGIYLLISDYIEVKWHNKSKAFYESKGYKFTKNGDHFDVKVIDLGDFLCTGIVTVKCDVCSKEFESKYSSHKSREFDICSKTCVQRKKHNNFVSKLEEKSPNKFIVLGQFKSFENHISVKCVECGFSYKVNPANILNKNIGCRNCKKKRLSELKREDISVVKSVFESKGYQLLDEQTYMNAHQKLKYICLKHPDKVQTTSYDSLKKQGACHECYYENSSGENHWNWKGGKTELNLYLRNLLSDWKQESLKSTNYRCFLSGIKADLEIHHPYSFSKIIQDTVDELGLSIHKLIGDYDSEDFKLLQRTFLSKHDKTLGIPLLPSLHSLFHSLCGYDNTHDQFTEFKIRYENGEFTNMIIKNK
jgi:hypothetical protein